jgi:hypothetical protein
VFRLTSGYAVTYSCSGGDNEELCSYRKELFFFEIVLIVVTFCLTIITTLTSVGTNAFHEKVL